MALTEFTNQVKQKIESNATRSGTPLQDVSGVIGEVALKLEAAELVLRNVLKDVMEKRNNASPTEGALWLSRIAYAAFTCKDAVLQISEHTGASGGLLSNPIQRAARDISIAANHVVFAKAARYADVGKARLE